MSEETNGAPRGSSMRGGRGGRGGAVKKAGPRPARHIPWPEIFKHHISLVEGHLKMIDMVRKHTVDGSGNQRTIQNLVDRAHDMMRDAKTVQREFVPPKDAWKAVPIGSASDTMYPGYSPKDVQYGKAAEEFGKEWSEARKKGIEFKPGPDGPEYQFGQAKAAKRRRLSEIQATESGSEAATAAGNPSKDAASATNSAAAAPSSGDALFYVDSNPTPVNGVAPLAKRPKKEHKIEEPVVEYENIDKEVDARLKLKEDAQKNEKDKKRKRDSAASAELPTGSEEVASEKPAKKKSKSKKKDKEATTAAVAEKSDVEMVDASPKKSEKDKSMTVDDADDAVESSSKKSKKSKKNKTSAEGEDADGERKKKKSKKSKSTE